MPANPPGYAQGTQAGYPPPIAQQIPLTNTYVAANTHTVVVGSALQAPEYPYNTTCPSCNAPILTAAEYKSGALTWIICVVLTLVGCFLGCCLIPFCINSTKDVVHTCPRCNIVVGQHKRI
ncbi:hypothetical protein HELRODRAFT_64675 [Helobdella robusta]|uniref:LITAF domain-containing protein n=1 Tax=Helobdella robusta TaxID=6412 RepID=T1FXX9_HELRO|nr:hypothetical protein HELRODRAFT_64675 [Helobdella robusta]ESO06655.1 hypothetical protein HELRODRAFT_64675 [Helobdella robusta]